MSLFFFKSSLYEQVEAFNQTTQQNMDKAWSPLPECMGKANSAAILEWF